MNKTTIGFFLVVIIVLLFFAVNLNDSPRETLSVSDTCATIPSVELYVGASALSYAERDVCYEKLALSSKNPSFCKNISSTSITDSTNQPSCEAGMALMLAVSREKLSDNPNFTSLAYEIGKGNYYVKINNFSVGCLPYRSSSRGCYYDVPAKYYLVASSLTTYNLNKEERIYLCYKLAYPGGVAYCLQSNAQIEECLSFAKDNEELRKICTLREGELIE